MKHDQIDPSEDYWRYLVASADGRELFGPFASEAKATFFATVRWPQQDRDFNHSGKGWSIMRGNHVRTWKV